jgi:hypothetical protein
MPASFRKIPPVCLGISIVRLIFGRLRLPKTYVGHIIRMEDGEQYSVFRHIHIYPEKDAAAPVTFIVSFKFSRFSYNANRIISIIPMLLITGFPGFQTKMYGVNMENGYWQGMYQWESEKALEDYKLSLVYRMMNRRAVDDSISSKKFPRMKLLSFVEINKS